MIPVVINPTADLFFQHTEINYPPDSVKVIRMCRDECDIVMPVDMLAFSFVSEDTMPSAELNTSCAANHCNGSTQSANAKASARSVQAPHVPQGASLPT